MELEIQKWVRKTKPFMKESEELFNEAVECYKVGANRAAFIMSYLAYEKEVQLRVLNFKSIPNNVKELDWENIKKDLLNDKKWEWAVFASIKDGIIKLSDQSDIVKKLGGYKVTRNACVHGKNQTINSATVEEFWNFLRDNLFRFNINGGKDYFKESIFKSFRDRNENIDITYDDLLESLIFSDFNEDELIEIWEYVNKKINELYGVDEIEVEEFWNKLLFNRDERIQKSFIKYTQKDCLHFMNFYKMNNSLLNLSINISDGISFKKEVLYQWIKGGQPSIYENEIFWDFIIKILDHIPKEDKKGFLKLLSIKNIRYLPSSEQTSILKNNGFFCEMEDYLYTELQYDYDKVPDRLKYLKVIVFIAKNSLNDEIINMLANYWSKLKYYSKYPKSWDSLCIFEENLLDDKDAMNNLIKIANGDNFKFIYNSNIDKMIKKSEELESLY